MVSRFRVGLGQPNPLVVGSALNRITTAEFKRQQTPPPLRITQKALGRGWNYPVAAEYGHIVDPDR